MTRPPNSSSRGLRLRAFRESLGLTQREIGERLGISEAGYRHYEADRAKLSAEDLPVLAVAMGVELPELLERLGFIAESEREQPTIEMIVRNIRGTPDLSHDDKDLLVRLVERSRRIVRGEPDAEQ